MGSLVNKPLNIFQNKVGDDIGTIGNSVELRAAMETLTEEPAELKYKQVNIKVVPNEKKKLKLKK